MDKLSYVIDAEGCRGSPRWRYDGNETMSGKIHLLEKNQPFSFALSEMTSSNDAVDVMNGILKAVDSGEITPDEANRISSTIETYRKTLETSEFENRIVALEKGKAQ